MTTKKLNRNLSRILSLIIVSLLAFSSLGAISIASENTVYETSEVAELRSIINDIILQTSAVNTRIYGGVDIRSMEYLHLHPEYYNAVLIGADPRQALLFELHDIFQAALAIQKDSADFATYNFVMSMWASPILDSDETRFNIGFSREEYLPLADIVTDFLGITSGMLIVEILCPSDLVFGEDMADFTPSEESDFLIDADYDALQLGIEPRLTRIPMGAPLTLRFHHAITGVHGTMPATLGHPANIGGSRAFTTNHGIVPVGAEVLWNGIFVGTVTHANFDLNSGADASEILFFSTFRVENSLSNPSVNIINLNGQRPSNNSAVRWAARGNRNGTVNSSSVNFPTANGTLRNLIRVSTINNTEVGDSGAGLIQGTSAVGTLVGFNRNSGNVYFSSSQTYTR